jgi:hypothetical protein
VAPWISLVIGSALVILGIALLAGFELNVRVPRLDRGGREGSRRWRSSESYAVASLRCELRSSRGISGVFGRGLASGVAYFVAFTLGSVSCWCPSRSRWR